MPTLPFLRFDQLFPAESWAPQVDNGQMSPYGDDYIKQRLEQLYTPEHTMSDRLDEMLRNFPQRNQPGLGRSIIASIAGFGGGPQAAEDVQYAPYNRELKDWQAQYAPTYQAATNERYENVNERNFANQEVSRELQERKQTEQERAAGVKEQQANEKIEISRTRAAAYDFKQRNPQMKLQEDDKGNLIGVNPITRESQYILDPNTGAPVKSAKLPDEDRINLQIQGRLKVASAQHDYRTEEIGTRGEEARKTLKERTKLGGTAAAKPLSPAAVKVDRYNRARQLADQNPDWKDAIILGKGNDFEIDESQLGPGESDIIYEYIYKGDRPDQISSSGKDIELPASGETTTPSTPSVSAPQPVVKSGPKLKNPNDRIIVQAPDGGQQFSLPREQKDRAIAKGYKVIKE